MTELRALRKRRPTLAGPAAPLAVGIASLLLLLSLGAGQGYPGSPTVPVELAADATPSVLAENIAGFDALSGSSAPLSVGAGDAIVVVVSAHYRTSVTAVTDSAEDHFVGETSVQSGSSSASASLSIWVAANVPATADLVVSATLTRIAPSLLAVAVVDGTTASAVDAIGPGSFATNSKTVDASVTTVSSSDLVVLGVATSGSPSVTPVGGLTVVNDLTKTVGKTQETGAILSMAATTAGAQDLEVQLSTKEHWAAGAIAFAPSSGSPPPEYAVGGTVFGTDKAPLAGATVSAQGTSATGVSNSQGAYQILLPNGTYSVSAVAEGYSPATQSVTVEGAPLSKVNFTLVPSTSLPGDGAIQHVVVIYFENEPIANVWAMGPYERYLAAHYGNASKFYAACHPSIPNYLASTAGVDYGCGSDAYHVYSVTNLPDLLEAAGLTWAGYFENMSAPCDPSNNVTYVVHHNPFLYYSDIVDNATDPERCVRHDLPARNWTSQVAGGTLLNYSFYVPNNLDDGENTSVAYADGWLQKFLSPLLNTTNPTLAKTMSHTVFFILYDESKTSDTSGYNGTHGGHIYFVAVSPFSRGIDYTTDATDYSLLSTIEWLFGLGSTGHKDGTSEFPAMTGLFQFA